MKRMQSVPGFVYYGEREGWFIAATQAPDWGDALQRSNFRSMLRQLGGESTNVAVEQTGGALGRIDYLLVRPCTNRVAQAEEMLSKIADYVVLNEDDLSELEWNEEWCCRCDSATREDHPTARCGKFRSKQDAEDIRYRWQHRD